MSKLTAKEIIKKLEESEIEVRDFAYDCADGGYDYLYEDESIEAAEAYEEKFKALKEELGWAEIEQKGGEGQGDEWYCVKFFPEHGVYIKTEGWYSSYHGTYFEDGFGIEVKPEQVVTINWKEVE